MKLRKSIKRLAMHCFPIAIHGKQYALHPADMQFWQLVSQGQWEEQTFKCLDQYLTPESLYLDVGTWIGPTVLYAAERCKTVYCIEPDPVAYSRLLDNITNNQIDNVLPFHGALCTKSEIIKITNDRGFGNSMSRTNQNINRGDTAQVIGVDINRLLELFSLSKIDFIKMDIEGGEFDLIPSLFEFIDLHKPHFHLSLHTRFFPKGERNEKLAVIAELAKKYTYCLDIDMNEVDSSDLLSSRYFSHNTAIFLTETKLSA